MAPPRPSSEPLTDLVRGQIDMNALGRSGVRISIDVAGVSTDEDAHAPYVSPPLEDFAYGLIASWAKGPESLQLWSRLVLAINSIDFGAFESDSRGELLLEAIWDAAAGRTHLDEGTVSRIKRFL